MKHSRSGNIKDEVRRLAEFLETPEFNFSFNFFIFFLLFSFSLYGFLNRVVPPNTSPFHTGAIYGFGMTISPIFLFDAISYAKDIYEKRRKGGGI